ncbi:MAG: alpha/beta fold hydrolase [Oscillospiraceae bacterium]|nr:alpha/beta fold hydrolase [Oscillospiraceae bacterium]
MEKALFIKNEKYDIPAIVNIPAGEKLPFVVMCHGTASDKNEAGNMYADLAAALAEKGVASIRMDFAGCGDSTDSGINQTFMNEVSDTVKAYEYMCENETVDTGRMGIIGFSQGGRVMAQFMDTHRDKAKAAVSWSGACHNGIGVFAGWFEAFYEKAVKEGYVAMPMDWRSDFIVPLQWFEDIRNTNPMDALKKYTGPLLCVAGSADVLVPCAHADEIAATNEKAEVIIYEGADHTFNVLTGDKSIAQDVITTTADWLAENL